MLLLRKTTGYQGVSLTLRAGEGGTGIYGFGTHEHDVYQ